MHALAVAKERVEQTNPDFQLRREKERLERELVEAQEKTKTQLEDIASV
jgi:alkylated DNA nucleotide flippase Atl1